MALLPTNDELNSPTSIANVKQVLSVILAVLIFNLTITAVNGAGILITLAGGELIYN